jgi:cell division protein FtsI/penicillin-binding protein 2
MQNRIRFLSLISFLGLIVLIARLFYWQIIKGAGLALQAQGQYVKRTSVSAPRGNILANDGTWLAARGESYLVYASIPDLSENKNLIADSLAPHFIDKNVKDEKPELLREASRLKELLSKEDLVWIPLKHGVGLDDKQDIANLDLAGIGFENEDARIYPEASAAAHLLGFVGKNEEGENQGYFGLEGYYDLVLSGKPGFVQRDSDALGIPIMLDDFKETGAQNGIDLLTYIDKSVQMTVENKLKEGIEKYGAKNGTIVVMDPKTGGILADASYPSYDPREYFNFGNDYFINPAVSLSFEPGSVFKVIVMASALDVGVVEPDTKCDICSGPVKVDKYLIETWNQQYRPDSTMTDVIVHSDNVGMVYVARKLGLDNMYEYLTNFGISQTTGIDLQGEMTPKIRDKKDWSQVDLSTVSFGQGIAVTPIQLITAVNAIANNGILVKPKVVRQLISDNWTEDVDTGGGKRVVSEKAAKEMTAMMVEAAQHGEAQWTYLPGFKIAGKTGTAQIPIAGHYDAEKTIASFVGFAPANEPKFVMLVTLQEPQSSPWAAETAAPLWFSIAKDLFVYFGIQPEK